MVTDDRMSGTAVVTPVGQLDLDTASKLHVAFDRLRARSVTRVVVDLGSLTYCDSTGLSALALARTHCVDSGGYLRLVVPDPFVLQLVTALGIARTVPIYRSVRAACAGDLDDLVAVPRHRSPWTVPGQPTAANRWVAVPRATRDAATPPNVPARTRRPVAPAATGLPAAV